MKTFIVGSGGHTKNIKSFLNSKKKIFFIDKKINLKKDYFGNDEDFFKKVKKENLYEIYMGIGLPNKIRTKVFKLYKNKKIKFKTFIHKSSHIPKNLVIGEGSIIFPNVTIGNDVIIGKNCIIYSNAVVEHDTTISNHCYVAPSATICGSVKIGEECFIGANSCIVENIIIKANSFIKANKLVK